jgi:hypothetical protein
MPEAENRIILLKEVRELPKKRRKGLRYREQNCRRQKKKLKIQNCRRHKRRRYFEEILRERETNCQQGKEAKAVFQLIQIQPPTPKPTQLTPDLHPHQPRPVQGPHHLW